MSDFKISIVIPTLNEAKGISKLLQHLIDNSSSKNIKEIIIVDGGSTDNTQQVVESLSGRAQSRPNDLSTALEATAIKLITSPKGRAKQMNTGADFAKGEILYFLHADSFPPKNFDQLIINEVKKGNKAGCFKMKFDSNHWWLRLAGWFTQFNWKACRGGDQSQFITKMVFNELGGFNDQFHIYEDYDLINKLYKRNEFVVIQHCLTTSARRYNTNGIWRLQFHFWMIYFKKWTGASVNDLHTYYKKYIA